MPREKGKLETILKYHVFSSFIVHFLIPPNNKSGSFNINFVTSTDKTVKNLINLKGIRNNSIVIYVNILLPPFFTFLLYSILDNCQVHYCNYSILSH